MANSRQSSYQHCSPTMVLKSSLPAYVAVRFRRPTSTPYQPSAGTGAVARAPHPRGPRRPASRRGRHRVASRRIRPGEGISAPARSEQNRRTRSSGHSPAVEELSTLQARLRTPGHGSVNRSARSSTPILHRAHRSSLRRRRARSSPREHHWVFSHHKGAQVERPFSNRSSGALVRHRDGVGCFKHMTTQEL